MTRLHLGVRYYCVWQIATASMSLSPGCTLFVIAAVLGGIVVILGLIYGYIYYTQIKPRPRRFGEARFEYETKLACKIEHAQQAEQPEKTRIKTHPFFIMNYIPRVRSDHVTPNTSGCSHHA